MLLDNQKKYLINTIDLLLLPIITIKLIVKLLINIKNN